MDVIELSSYTEFEKKEIFKRHLLNKAIADVLDLNIIIDWID